MHTLNKTISLLLLIYFSCQSIFAQPQGFKPISNIAVFKQKLSEASRAANTIQSDFIQEKHLTVLSDKIVSSGKFYFKKENQLRWEYISPIKYLIILSNNKVYIKDDNKTNQYDLGSNKVFKEINSVMSGAVQGNLLQDETKYKSAFYENSKNYLVILTPIDKIMKDYIKSIYLYFDKKNFSVTMLKLVENSDDYTLIQFNNRKQNLALSADLFKIK
jgi:outer membrane lipoprotein-sorting protein